MDKAAFKGDAIESLYCDRVAETRMSFLEGRQYMWKFIYSFIFFYFLFLYILYYEVVMSLVKSFVVIDR